MKKIKSFLLSNLAALGIIPIAIAASCSKQPVENNQKDKTDSNKKDTKDPSNDLDTTSPSTPIPGTQGTPGANGSRNNNPEVNGEEVKKFIANKSFDQLFKIKNQTFNNTIETSSISANEFTNKLSSDELKIESLNDIVKVEFANPIKNSDNQSVTLYVKIAGIETPKQFTLTGFKREQVLDIQPPQKQESEFSLYRKMTQVERYKKDIQDYDPILARNSQPRNLGISDAEKAKFDEKANSLNLPTYDRANLLGMTIPKYDSNGTFLGLDIKTDGETPKGPSWVDNYRKDGPKNRGLARTITNETYSNIAMQTYQFSIVNWKISSDANERKITGELLKNDEDLTILINRVQNTEKRKEFLDKYKKIKGVPAAVKLLVDDKDNIGIWQQLIIENGSETEAAKIYTEYIKQHREKIKNKVNANTVLKQDTKERINKFVDEATDFYELSYLHQQMSGVDGTAWIMDYEIPENGKYPTKFYFGTNLHVIDGMSPDTFVSFGLARLSKDRPSILNTLKVITQDDAFKMYGFGKNALTRIFDGRDYLKADPVNFLADKSFDKKEYIDFAIFEVDFAKTEENTEEKIREITNDYADLPAEKKAQFANYDYLTSYDKINVPLAGKGPTELEKFDNLYILGYPKTNSGQFLDYYLDKYEDENQLKHARNTFSLWTNASYKFYKSHAPSDTDVNKKKELELGSWLSYNIGYRTFIDKPGINDQFLSTPVNGNGLYRSNDGKQYVSMNLAYAPKQYIPGGGASGSSIRTKENKIVAIFHSANAFASVGLSAALRSSGFDYQGLYGTYNLPQYDVIYGTGKDQQNSYRHEMLKRNKGRTWLFQNGFEESNVPKEFKFK
ncbi:Ig-specific serine endopeptidase MIP [Mycoplasmopsis edwardii]|nr:DUF31 family protein [Mycoplasmopsis edwardii]